MYQRDGNLTITRSRPGRGGGTGSKAARISEDRFAYRKRSVCWSPARPDTLPGAAPTLRASYMLYLMCTLFHRRVAMADAAASHCGEKEAVTSESSAFACGRSLAAFWIA
jgi:hypothetical protein